MEDVPALLEQSRRAYEKVSPWEMADMISMFTSLPQYAAAARMAKLSARPLLTFTTNEEMWKQFHQRKLPDTTYIRLDHFHLFEWFPLSPGLFHSQDGKDHRRMARTGLQQDENGDYYDPYGKLHMVKGGLGAVKLAARPVADETGYREPHYLMTASANGVCHEGVPVLIPRHKYGELIHRIRDEGAAPVVIEGEMQPLPEDARTFFEQWRLANIPRLVIYAHDVRPLAQPRSEVTGYHIAVALSFYGTFQEQQRVYMTFCTFDPASQTSREQSITWIKQYVQNYQGQAITDFDEEDPEFRNAPFALQRVMNGTLDPLVIQEMMNELGFEYFGNSAKSVQQSVKVHNTFIDNYIGPRGVQVQGDVNGPIITGDDNKLGGTDKLQA